MTNMNHGTMTCYTHYSCRCEDCKQAATEYNSKKREERKLLGLPSGDRRHGTKNGYTNYGCRCDECRLASTGASYSLRVAGFGHEVYIRELGGWFQVGEKVG